MEDEKCDIDMDWSTRTDRCIPKAKQNNMKRKRNNRTCTEVLYNIGPLLRQAMLDNHFRNLKKSGLM